jgi:hypothetical protein
MSEDIATIDRIFRPGDILKQITRKSSKHFLINMKKDLDFINEHNSDEYVEKLSHDLERTNNYHGIVENSHLIRWIEIISDE